MSGRWGCRPLGGTEVKDQKFGSVVACFQGGCFPCARLYVPESTVILPGELVWVDRPTGLIRSGTKVLRLSSRALRPHAALFRQTRGDYASSFASFFAAG